MNALTVQRLVPADHPAFAGHFPGQPLLPGVSLLAEVMEAARAEPALQGKLERGSFTAAKFLSPVRPGSMLRIALQWDEAALGFEVHCGPALAAKGQWRWDSIE
ncbi:MAG: hypothetical protein AB1430_03870 [Pseudomonadota bacterium]